MVSSVSGKLCNAGHDAHVMQHGFIEPENNRPAGSCGERQPVHEKPAGIFTEAEVWVAVQQIYRLCMRVFISMAAFDF